MAFGTNVKIDVATYNKSAIGALYNHNPLIQTLNKKFKNFETMTGQKGTTCNFDIPPTVDYIPSLGITSFGGYTQKEFPITVDQEGSIPTGVDNLERLFNFDHTGMMSPIAMSSVNELGSRIGKNVALDFKDHTYFTFGDGTNSILSFQSLNQAVMNFDDMGTMDSEMCMIIPTTASAAITGQGLSQFVMQRNEEIASTWYVASIGNVDVYHTNLLPRHVAGSVGQADATLTVISINAAGDQLTMSGAVASDADAIKAGDILTFQDIAPAQPNMRNLAYYGGVVTGQPVQVRAEADAAADGSGDVVVNIYPPLNGTSERDANVNNPVAAGMQLKALNSHTCGGYYSKSAFMLAMPNLGSTSPYEYSSLTDKDGISMRIYNGFFTDTAQTGYVHQAAWGKRLVDRYAMRLAFPY